VVAIAILVVAIGLEGFSFRTAMVESRPLKGAVSWWRFIRHAKMPELPVVLLEDVGALLGLVFAACGVGLALATGNPRWDALGSVAIGLLLGVIAFILAVEMKSLRIGEAAAPETADVIRTTLEQTENVDRLIHLRTSTRTGRITGRRRSRWLPTPTWPRWPRPSTPPRWPCAPRYPRRRSSTWNPISIGRGRVSAASLGPPEPHVVPDGAPDQSCRGHHVEAVEQAEAT
jgi:hypothetical protein